MIFVNRVERHPRYRLKLDQEATVLKVRLTEIKDEQFGPKPEDRRTIQIPWPEQKIELKALRDHPAWMPVSIFSFALRPAEKTLIGPLPALADSFMSRTQKGYYSNRGVPTVLSVLVPFQEANFSECGLVINIQTNEEFDCSRPTSPSSFREAMTRVFPTIKIEGPSSVPPGGTTQLKVQVRQNNNLVKKKMMVDLEAISGYLPKKKIEIQNGEATIKVVALALESGEQLRIKAGFPQFAGADEYVLKVT